MSQSVQQLNEQVRQEAAVFQDLLKQIGSVVVGQDRLLNRMLIALLCQGHLLIEGMPGLAKTLAVRTLASAIEARFQRIQFTPDLLPADLIGTQIFNPRTSEFVPRLGPIFSNIVLADEINRAPAKVQSALLEAMEERQVTIGEQSHVLPSPFIVLATQNPIEQQGTYPLPEAQLDRFMMKVEVGYPSFNDERLILDRMTDTEPAMPVGIIGLGSIVRAREFVIGIYVDDKIKDYALKIVTATRDRGSNAQQTPGRWIEYGASPRATIALVKAAKAVAFLRGRSYVTPDDVKQVAGDVLRHRIIPTFEAQAESITTNQLVNQVLTQVHVP
jgi:MoxR-like ATPase